MNEYYGAPNDFRGYLMHYGILGMKWGVRRYQNADGSLTNAGKVHYGYTNKIHKKASEQVDTISNDISSAVSLAGGKMYGLENRLKSKDSIQRKINKKAAENNISLKEASKGIKDAVRFTAIFKTNNFVKGYNNVKRYLEKNGYTETRCKNYFDLFNKGKVKHKSVQCNYLTKDGYEFEVQFQTPESQKAKNEKIPLYEERRRLDISPNRAKELERLMEELARQVPEPEGIERIKSH